MYNLIKHPKLNRFFPLIITLICGVLYGISIMGFENHKKQGDDVYVSLLPADPRSLLQGDYMALRYELHLDNPNAETTNSNDDTLSNDNETDFSWEYDNPKFDNQHQITLWISKDDKGVLNKSYFDKQQNTTPLIIKNPNNALWGLYPASKSFFFAEGLGECYQNAKFAHLKVDKTGKPLLVGLVGDELKPLNCEQTKTAH